MRMTTIRRAFAGIGAGLIALVFTPTTPADATTHYGPRITVDLRRLPKGDCWYEIDRHHTETLCATPHPAPHGDCTLVAPADYRLCNTVRDQRAYGWTTDDGTPLNWTPNGRALVRDITHQGYTQSEMADALAGAHRDYRAHVTAITFNVDAITRRCGHHMGNGVVQEVKGTDGHHYTWKRVVCD